MFVQYSYCKTSNRSRVSNTSREQKQLVLIEAWGFYLKFNGINVNGCKVVFTITRTQIPWLILLCSECSVIMRSYYLQSGFRAYLNRFQYFGFFNTAVRLHLIVKVQHEGWRNFDVNSCVPHYEQYWSKLHNLFVQTAEKYVNFYCFSDIFCLDNCEAICNKVQFGGGVWSAPSQQLLNFQ